MKLSDMRTEDFARTLLSLSGPVSRICEDEQLPKIIMQTDKKTAAQQVGILFRSLLPWLLDTHKNDTYTILGALTGKTPVEIGDQPIRQTIADIRDSVDQELLDFFTSAAAINPVK